MLGKTIARKYKITAQVGVGGMGCVYRAEHNVLGRQSALKVLHSQLNSDKTFIQRFMREARAMARLDHDNIVRIYDVFEEDGLHYIAMELFEGPSLKTVLENHGNLSLEQTVSIIAQCARGLAYAHAQGIVHRDIKPSNIMLNSEGRIKITDFGIAAAMDDAATLTNTGQLVGTPRYMSPEQAKNGNIDRRSDLYSLGIVFYELVTGHTPFDGDSGVAIIGKLAYESDEIPLEFESNVPIDMRDLIRKMLLRHQDERIQHATHLMSELSKLSTKTENIDSTVTSTLSLIPIEEYKGEVKKEQSDRTMVLPERSDLAKDSDGSHPSTRAQSQSSLREKNYPTDEARKVKPLIAVAAVLMLATLAGLFYFNTSDEDNLDFAGSMPSDEESTLAIAVQKGLYQLLEKKTSVDLDKNNATSANAQRLSGFKFGSASDKYLIAEGAITAVERDIKEKRYISAQQSIERANKVFDAASVLFKQAYQESLASVSSDIFMQADKLKKQTMLAARKLRNEKFTGAFKNNYQKAVRMSKQATRKYDQARLYFNSKKIVAAKRLLAEVQQGYSEAETIYTNLAGYVQSQDAIDKVYGLQSKLNRIQLRVLDSKERANNVKAKSLASAQYRKAIALHKQLSERTKEAKYLLREKEYRIAGVQFQELINFANEVVENFNKSEQIAQQQAKVSPAINKSLRNTQSVRATNRKVPRRRPSQQDIAEVERMLRKFKDAYESRNLDLLQTIADLSPTRLETAKEIFTQFNEIHLSVTSYSLVSGGATADIRIDRVVTANGDNVVPSTKWRDGTLELNQTRNGWGKIVWR